MKITIYSTTSCPYCKMLKKFLTENNKSYTEKIVDQDDAALAEMQKLSDGHMGVPFTVVEMDGGKTEKVIGFDEKKFREVLGL